MSGSHTLGDDLFKPVDLAVDQLMGDPTAAFRNSSDLTRTSNSHVARVMAAPFLMQPRGDGKNDNGQANAMADARFAALPGVHLG